MIKEEKPEIKETLSDEMKDFLDKLFVNNVKKFKKLAIYC